MAIPTVQKVGGAEPTGHYKFTPMVFAARLTCVQMGRGRIELYIECHCVSFIRNVATLAVA